jgi:hydroxyacyl-ACP dehydratase HTD2-like protein with hotdog domain
MNVADLKARFTGSVFDEIDLDVDADSLVGFALACGETDPKFTDPSHPDFQAVPNYPTRIHGTRQLPPDFPVEMQRCFDAGKSVVVHAPVRAGEKITGRSEIADIYEKSGRSGSMLFIVHRMNFYGRNGVHLATVDWRLVQREFNP